jgi:hypothetical protein
MLLLLNILINSLARAVRARHRVAIGRLHHLGDVSLRRHGGASSLRGRANWHCSASMSLTTESTSETGRPRRVVMTGSPLRDDQLHDGSVGFRRVEQYPHFPSRALSGSAARW